jgi:hypothetical protein
MKRTGLAFLVSFVALASFSACGGGAGSADAAPDEADAEVSGGTFSASWTLTDGTNPISCSAVGASLVRFDFLPSGGTGGNGFVGVFDCAAGSGTSEHHDPGTYDAQVQLKDAFGHVMASATAGSGVKIVEGANTPLDPVAFTITTLTGSLRATLHAPGASNCGAEPTGAGLTATRVELRTGDGTCIPTAFKVAAGTSSGTPAQDIAAGCPGAVSPCIENDQEITAEGLAAGSYLLAFDGFEGGSTTATCYATTIQVSISGAGLETNVGDVALPITSDMDAGCVPP